MTKIFTIAPTRKAVADVRRSLMDLRPLLRPIGELVISDAQRAFNEKKFGQYQWPKRYPAQSPPFINIAGALNDLNNGSKLKDRRFSNENVLEDTGSLKKWFASKTKPLTVISWTEVEVGVGGPAKSHAKFHQWGLKPSRGIKVTQLARETLAKQTKAARRSKSPRLEALKKLGFLFQVDRLNTRPHHRPFLGVLDQTAADIREMVEMFVMRKGKT